MTAPSIDLGLFLGFRQSCQAPRQPSQRCHRESLTVGDLLLRRPAAGRPLRM